MKRTIIFILGFIIFIGALFCRAEDLEMRIFQLKHGNAEVLRSAVANLTSDEGKVTIAPDGNSLIVVDRASDLDRIGKVIEHLDVRQKQVEIKVLIVEVTDTFLGRIGLVSGQAVIPSDKFKEIQYLLQRGEHSSISSEMTVRTLSNKPATIQVAQERIFQQTTILPESGTPVTSYIERSAGNFLEVLPKVNSDGTITVTIRPTLSSFEKMSDVYERSILTQVIVNNGDTIALGGLDTEEERTRQANVPFTDISIPSERLEKKKIVMFLTPTISD